MAPTWVEGAAGRVGPSIRPVLERTGRPVIFVDLWRDPRLTYQERDAARAIGLRSGLAAPMLWHGQLIGILSVGSRRAGCFGPRDAQFVVSVATHVTAIVRLAGLVEQLREAATDVAEARERTVLLLAAAAEVHDQTIGQHFRGVRALSEALARELGYGEVEAGEIGLAAALHDIGKMRVPLDVLQSTGELNAAQWEMMKRHTVWGQQFLSREAGFELAATIARYHHERWDGSGYPDGVAGEGVPEPAAIAAVADAFDAITSTRAYRPARSVNAAVEEIRRSAGTQFSPKVVAALARLHERGELPHVAALDERAAA
jgi:HD-GYP domain-containing protein (c-di-GMP phosphodiesterase class II)